MNNFKDITINDSRDAEKFLSKFVWNIQFNFDIDRLDLEEAPNYCTKEGKIRHRLRQLFEDNNAIKHFLLNNWHPETVYGNNQFTYVEYTNLLALIESCIKYLDQSPLIKENFINSIISSYNYKLSRRNSDSNYETDTTIDDFIIDCNEQFNTIMNENDAWSNID